MKKQILTLVTITIFSSFAYAQSGDKKDKNESTFKIGFDIRPRFEYRHGFKQVVAENTEEATFIRQRSRINFSYDRKMNGKRLKAFIALQDVSTWGDTQQISPIDENNSLGLFQAWVEYNFNTTISVKLGRQTLSYDDQRILGGLDWAMQGRNHDLFLFKLNKPTYHLHVGLGLNNNTGEYLVEPVFENNAKLFSYKYMQFVHYNIKLTKGSLSFLVLNNMFQKTRTVVLASNPLTDGSYSRTTLGSYYKQAFNNLSLEASGYYQTGNSGTNGANSLGAYQAMLNLSYKAGKTLYGVGFEMLSGTAKDGTAKANTDSSFFPVYGTNHKFNGFMDYFYVGNHAGNVGLNDINAKVVLDAFNGKVIVKGHYFLSNAKLGKNKYPEANQTAADLDNYLGTEIDLVYKRKIAKDVLLIGGYSLMFASESMSTLKDVQNGHKSTNNWAWVMIKVNPTIFTYKTD